jgi:hypothetical protein
MTDPVAQQQFPGRAAEHQRMGTQATITIRMLLSRSTGPPRSGLKGQQPRTFLSKAWARTTISYGEARSTMPNPVKPKSCA